MSLLTLPAELRYQIYSYLTSSKIKARPFGDFSITAISHTPPRSNLQRACRFLYHDVTAYFYSIATVQITPGHFAANSTNNARSIAAIRRARNVEMVMIWYDDGWFTRPMLENGPGNWLLYKALEMKAIRTLNREAKCLKKLSVNVRGFMVDGVEWKEKEGRLDQLMEVKTGVTFVVGKVQSLYGNADELRTKVEGYVRKLNAERA